MIPIGKTEPSITFPVGAVIEDPMMVAEILYKYPKTRIGHMYKVKVLEWKMEIGQNIKQHLDDPNEIHICVVQENMDKIQRIK